MIGALAKDTMKEVVSIGKIEDLVVPVDLEYRNAIFVLAKDLIGTGITIDLASFYSIEPIELHNFVDSFIYRFVEEDGFKFISYSITSRPNDIYREVDFGGNVAVSSSSDLEFSGSGIDISSRKKRYLGV